MAIDARAAAAGPDTALGGAVVLEDVRHAFGRVEALAGVSLQAGPGEVVAVVGPSGCGKSTLLELVCGLQRPTAGTVRAGRAVLMPQRDVLLPWLAAVDNAALALRVAGRSRAQARAAARPVLDALGLGGFEEARPAQLSGGMRQRVAVARTLLAGAPSCAWTSRSARSTRSPGPRRRRGSARC
jgi:NitT/TauT family transport system ATP-binding protein